MLAGREYGSGSSRDWAAKGTKLLGVRAVIAQSFERIHRSNLIGMGVLPLQFPAGRERASRSASRGEEVVSITGIADAMADGGAPPRTVRVRAEHPAAATRSSSTRPCASTRRARPTTSATAASCSTCCAACSLAEHGTRCSRATARGPAGAGPRELLRSSAGRGYFGAIVSVYGL